MNRRQAFINTAMIVGAATVAPSLFALLQSCQQEDRLSWQPKFLSTEHALLISALVDTILPKTTTPGGLDVKVDIFIDMIMNTLFDEAGQKSIMEEMTAFNSDCEEKFGDKFHKLSISDRTKVLTLAEYEGGKYNRKIWGTDVGPKGKPIGFYRSIKSMALWGYCTSEEIGVNVLPYDPIPGEYRGCIAVSEVIKS